MGAENGDYGWLGRWVDVETEQEEAGDDSQLSGERAYRRGKTLSMRS